MGDLNAWLLTTFALLPPLALAVAYCGRGSVGRRLAAVQFLSSIGLLLLVTMSFAFDQASSIDLALTLAILTLPAILLLALFAERWL